jgi:DNA polymerase-3 subunit delta'
LKPLPWHRAELDRLIASKGSLAHAFLVSGARGIGKLEFGRALAQALLCESPARDGYACGTCVACAWFEAGTHPDYRQVEPESVTQESGDDDDQAEPADKPEKRGKKPAVTIAVDQIRALPEFLNISSHRGGPKVIVVCLTRSSPGCRRVASARQGRTVSTTVTPA